MRIGLLLLGLAACGRLGFDATSNSDSGSGSTADAYTGCPVIAGGAGREHTCAVDHKGSVWCFGLNDQEQVLPNGPRFVPTPMRVVLPSPAVQVGGGRAYSCARLDDGTVQCWGQGNNGQLGSGSNTSGGPFAVMLGAERAVELAVGAHSSCIVRASDRAVMCWGAAQDLTIGQASMADSNVPLLVAGTAGTKRVTLGHRTACLIDAVDQPRCWGRNHLGQLAIQDGVARSIPTAPPGIALASRVAFGGVSGCVVKLDGNVQCWGSNERGQLGSGDLSVSANVADAMIDSATEIATSSAGSCALLTGGRMACWGDTAPFGGALDPTPRITQLTGVTGVLAGYYHRCALYDGVLGCWGDNTYGQLGRGVRSLLEAPFTVPLTGVTAVAVRESNACAIASGALYCWGSNQFGQLGDGTLQDHTAPTIVDTPLTAVVGVAVGTAHICAWGGNRVACWGAAGSGRLGINEPPDRRVRTPTIVANVIGVVQVGAGDGHTCARDGTEVKCWGGNFAGQLGNGTTMASTAPVTVLGAASATALTVGRHHGCAVTSGSARCWGRNNSGQLGDATQIDRPTAITPAVPGTVTSIDAGFAHTCALNSAAELYCWGYNGNGELGLGDRLDRLGPTRVTLSGPVSSFSVDRRGTCAKLVSGQIWCWGDAIGALLGVANADIPQHLVSFDGATSVVQSAHASCVIDPDASLRCWGRADVAGNQLTADKDGVPTPAAIPPCP